MYTDEIQSILENDPYAGPLFQGVYAIDQVPHQLQPRSLYVVNTQTQNSQNGMGHWVGLSTLQSPVSSYYFDSLGAPPPISLCESLLSVSTSIEFADVSLQNALTATCGQFVVVQALFLSRGLTPLQVTSYLYKLQLRGYLMADAFVQIITSSLAHLRDAPILNPEIFSLKKSQKNTSD